MTNLNNTLDFMRSLGGSTDTDEGNSVLYGLKARNSMLDSMFYDVEALTPQEHAGISPIVDREGRLLIVQPSATGGIQHCSSVEEYAEKGGAEIRALAVAGVGSSALGTAAFARNVADGLGEPVVGLISGYGVADLMAEALGGWYVFGYGNRLRHAFDKLFDLFSPPGSESLLEALTQSHVGLSRAENSPDTQTLINLLCDDRFPISFLIGHSKGNLVNSEALYKVMGGACGSQRPAGNKFRVVTVSAVVNFPDEIENVTHIIGEIDWFGKMNSRRDIDPDVEVPNAWHHLNTSLEKHLPLVETLKSFSK